MEKNINTEVLASDNFGNQVIFEKYEDKLDNFYYAKPANNWKELITYNSCDGIVEPLFKTCFEKNVDFDVDELNSWIFSYST